MYFSLIELVSELAVFNEAIKESLCFPGASVDLSALIAKTNKTTECELVAFYVTNVLI